MTTKFMHAHKISLNTSAWHKCEGPFKDTNIIREGGTEEPRLRRMENPSFSVILFFHCAASAPSLPPLLHIFSRPNGLRRCYGQGFLLKCDKESSSNKVPWLAHITHFEMRRRFDNPCESECLSMTGQAASNA